MIRTGMVLEMLCLKDNLKSLWLGHGIVASLGKGSVRQIMSHHG